MNHRKRYYVVQIRRCRPSHIISTPQNPVARQTFCLNSSSVCVVVLVLSVGGVLGVGIFVVVKILRKPCQLLLVLTRG